MKDGNRQAESAAKADVRKGNQPERVSSVERVGSKGNGGVSFPVHQHPDKSVVTKGKLAQ
jgi:hypothetical protein